MNKHTTVGISPGTRDGETWITIRSERDVEEGEYGYEIENIAKESSLAQDSVSEVISYLEESARKLGIKIEEEGSTAAMNGSTVHKQTNLTWPEGIDCTREVVDKLNALDVTIEEYHS